MQLMAKAGGGSGVVDKEISSAPMDGPLDNTRRWNG